MIDLNLSREKIDEVDKKIVELFEYRMQLAKDVAAYKIETGKKVFDREREISKLNTLSTLTDDTFNKIGIQELFTQIMSMSRKMQYSLIKEDFSDNPFTSFKEVLADKPLKVICFGEKGSYTERAMEEYFGENINPTYADSFKKVMLSVKEGHSDYGVLPIENTSTGGIADIYDLLVEFDNYIIGEHVIKIEHALLGLKGAKLTDIKTVYSHPQGLMQCQKFLEAHPEITPVKCISTSDSAKKVLLDGDVSQGAIAGRQSAVIYDLDILEESINHEQNNSTRFIIISRDRKYQEEADKVSICFELPHESGTLYNMLSHMIYNNLSMTKIESRPLEGRNFEYRFFVDFEGNLSDPGVRNALYGIKEEAISLKILGNY
ncbi:MAG: bifunctional chorismate mutase/prephenate dehydratase [Anaerocolumna sp.]